MQVVFDAHHDRQTQEQEQRQREVVVIAWTTAMLSRARAIPPLDRLLAGETSGAARPVAEEDKTDWQRDFDREWREAQQSE